MVIWKILLCAGWLISLHVFAEIKMERKDSINGVTVQTGKEESTRAYRGVISKIFPYSLETVKKSITNFTEKCNNKYKDKRKFTDKSVDCKYHNQHLVETFIVKDIKKKGWKKAPGEVERFLLGRQIYNRESFGYYELVQIIKGRNEKNQKTLTIIQRLLSEKETKKYTDPQIERDSAFDKTTSTFVLTEISPTETALNYEYKATTDHWILNKEIAVSQVFSSMSKSINDLIKTMSAESDLQTRDIASN